MRVRAPRVAVSARRWRAPLAVRAGRQSGCGRHTVRVREPHGVRQGYGADQAWQDALVESVRCIERTYCEQWTRRRLTSRWSQRRLTLEFMDGFGYTTIIEFAEAPASRRGSALDR